LDHAVRRAHRDGYEMRARGTFRVQHGDSSLSKWLCWVLRLPPAADSVETCLTITRRGSGEQWLRTFGNRPLLTNQSSRNDGILVERVAGLELLFRLEVVEGGLVYRQVGTAIDFGPFRLPLPHWCWPRIAAYEQAAGTEQTRVVVEVSLPIVGLLIAYTGTLAVEETRP
jgi:hypothetical protein